MEVLATIGRVLVGCRNHNTYQPCDGGSVLMGNDAACNIIGIGNIRMRMFDGQVRTLSNVRHVPDMRKNLLSLGALEAQGFRFSGEGGVIKVSKDSMTVLKGERVANLYRMKGSIIAGDASAATEKDDATRLWHMRLGHISERGL